MAVRALGQCHDFDQRSLLEPLVSPPVQPTPDASALLDEAARALAQRQTVCAAVVVADSGVVAVTKLTRPWPVSVCSGLESN